MRRRSGGFDRHPSAELRHVRFQNRRPGPVKNELPVPTRLDQPGARQLLQVVRDGRLAHWEAAAEPLTANLALSRDVLEDLEPARVRQGLRNSLELLGIQGPPRS